MAYTDKSYEGNMINNMFSDRDEMIPWIYNLTDSVGRGCANRRDDIMLVQALLGYTAEALQMKNMKSGFHADKVNGKFTPGLAKQIAQAQQYVKQLGMRMTADGKAHPAKKGGTLSIVECLNILAFQARGVWFKDFRHDFVWCNELALRTALARTQGGN